MKKLCDWKATAKIKNHYLTLHLTLGQAVKWQNTLGIRVSEPREKSTYRSTWESPPSVRMWVPARPLVAARECAASRHCRSRIHCLLEGCIWADPLTGGSLSPIQEHLNTGLKHKDEFVENKVTFWLILEAWYIKYYQILPSAGQSRHLHDAIL